MKYPNFKQRSSPDQELVKHLLGGCGASALGTMEYLLKYQGENKQSKMHYSALHCGIAQCYGGVF